MIRTRTIRTIVKINWLYLKRDVVALGLTFVLPLIFFSIFAVIFSGFGGGGSDAGPPAIDLLVVDLDSTETSRRYVAALGKQEALEIATAPSPTEEVPEPAPYTLEDARKRVREGRFPVAVVLPPGFGATLGAFAGDSEPVELIYDASNPIARHSVSGLLQAAAMTAGPDLLMKQGLGQLEEFGGPLTDQQRRAVEEAEGYFQSGEAAGAAGPGGAAGLVAVEAVDVRTFDVEDPEEKKRKRSIVPYQAAGIGVMFLLFSMAGAGGALLDEEESGVLERVLLSHASMTQLLLGKWLFYGVVGFAQVVLMFVWGALVFGIDLWTPNRLAGFTAMAVVTAAAAAAFGIVLATLCRTRSQLSGMSTIVILIMSALGGSMVPKFVMPDFMNTTALFTINGWALDGFLKVFWYDDPAASLPRALLTLAPQVAVLALMTVTFLTVARWLARRWETV